MAYIIHTKECILYNLEKYNKSVKSFTKALELDQLYTAFMLNLDLIQK